MKTFKEFCLTEASNVYRVNFAPVDRGVVEKVIKGWGIAGYEFGTDEVEIDCPVVADRADFEELVKDIKTAAKSPNQVKEIK